MDNELISKFGGYILAFLMGLIGLLKFYYGKYSDNTTKVRLSENEQLKQNRTDLEKQNKELLLKLDEIEIKLEHTERQFDMAINAIEIIFPLIKELIKDKPEYKETFEKALQTFKK